ncbi:MAG: branched-chain amino acid transaminase [Planctomycetes bacterium]|nr:branched-chain amino acid transaminase [Planctomycetota bacterium]
MDGKNVPFEKATIPIFAHTLHYGSGVFEGIRCYKTRKGPAVFRLKEHILRLQRSARCMLMEIPYDLDGIVRGVWEAIADNAWEACYVRPLVYRGAKKLGVDPTGADVHLAICTWEWGAYLGEEGLEKGIRIMTSSWMKNPANSMPTKAKVTGAYANSVVAKGEAIAMGFDEAMLLDRRGFIAEGSGENVFYVSGGVLHAVDNLSALEGITRESVIVLAGDLGIPVQVGSATKDQLYNADEIFFTGTAAEITPIREYDLRKIGEGRRGPVTERLQKAFTKAVRGEDERHIDWCEYAPAVRTAKAKG